MGPYTQPLTNDLSSFSPDIYIYIFFFCFFGGILRSTLVFGDPKFPAKKKKASVNGWDGAHRTRVPKFVSPRNGVPLDILTLVRKTLVICVVR